MSAETKDDLTAAAIQVADDALICAMCRNVCATAENGMWRTDRSSLDYCNAVDYLTDALTALAAAKKTFDESVENYRKLKENALKQKGPVSL